MSLGGGFFIVLPDAAEALTVAERLSGQYLQRVDHPSGRPWLLGSWTDQELTVGRSGTCLLVTIGMGQQNSAVLEAAAKQASTVHALDGFAASLIGSHNLIATDGSHIRVQGTASGMRRMYVARIDGVLVASDRADVLAGLSGAHLDDQMLALRLLDFIPYPLNDRSMWHGVELIEPGTYLAIRANGRTASAHSWWRPPEPVLPLAAGAARLRDALDAAVNARTCDGGFVSCDLSGGLDSTPVCYLAAGGAKRVLARTIASRDPADDDMKFALQAADDLPEITHLIVPADELPLFYSGVHDSVPQVDEPAPTVLDAARQFAGYERLIEGGAGIHLTGIGGDHLLTPPLAHCRDELTCHPVVAVRHLRANRAQERWPLLPVLSTVLRSGSYADWLRSAAEQVRDRQTPQTYQLLDWDMAPRVPSWLSADAVEIASEALRMAADAATPLSARRGIHSDVFIVRHGTRITRILHQLSAARGLPMESPYFDDRVVEACLAVRPLERATPWDFKTLIKVAMKDVVSPSLLTRQTKGAGAADKAEGLRQHQADLAAIWRDSHLGRRGLVDVDHLEDLLGKPWHSNFADANLDNTLSNELWLGSLSDRFDF
ncbi:asparagine synthase [Nocardia arthritidis]|uniref:Asparagine synthetase domain-containing protein n=1 Tax=Nocardia arthritidis TaxID=228602 RepID=A0A6G9YB52_9NOCA|nr:asparagine synthase [Nocardia arthritidis]QIS10459.1 hypothetical protein F5544_12850 [Nocardia arthritidis]